MSELSETSSLFPIPDSWEWKRFGDVAHVASNLIDPTEYPDSAHIAPNHIESNTGRLLPFKTISEDGVESPKHRFHAGQILYSKIRPYLAKVAIPDVPGLCSADMYPIDTSLNPRYLFWWMLHPRFTAAASRHEGRNVLPKINKAALSSLPVPVPPRQEQERITAVLDQVGALRAKRREAIALLDDLAQSVFLHMFGDPLSAPRSTLRRLGDISDIQTGPFGSLLHKEDYVQCGVPLVNPMHIIDGEIAVDEGHTVTEAKARQLHSFRLIPGDVVLGRRGEMGRCAVVREKHGDLLCGTGSLIIRPHPEEASGEFLAAVLSHSSVKRRLQELSLGATLPNLNQKIVGGMKVSIPSRIEQDRFLSHVTAAREAKQVHLAHLASLDKLFASIQHRAFSGTLWDQEATA